MLVDSPKSNIWFKMVPIGRNTLAKLMQSIASIASLDGKFTNSSGRKIVIQALRDDFDPLEILELTGHTNPESISSYTIILWKNSSESRIGWPVLTQARQLPTAIEVIL